MTQQLIKVASPLQAQLKISWFTLKSYNGISRGRFSIKTAYSTEIIQNKALFPYNIFAIDVRICSSNAMSIPLTKTMKCLQFMQNYVSDNYLVKVSLLS